jgi:hypothetical protein
LLSRIDIHEIAFSWVVTANSILSQLGIIQNACKEMNNSQILIKKLMAIILAIGNYLNGGTSRGQVFL